MSEAKVFRRVSTPVPGPLCVTGNGEVESEGECLRKLQTTKKQPGKGKTGRANANESLIRLRYVRSSKVAETMIMGLLGSRAVERL